MTHADKFCDPIERLPAEVLNHRLGTVEIEPSGPVVAGSVGQWTLTYTVGNYGVDERGTVMLAHRFASDWQIPQFERPAEQAYTTVTTTGDARLACRYDPKAFGRPFSKCLVIDVCDGYLAPGDVVRIVLGDRGHGSPGIRAQTFQETAHEFRFMVDPTNASVVRRLPTSPAVPIIPGGTKQLVVIVPTRVRVGEPGRVFAKGQDAWVAPDAGGTTPFFVKAIQCDGEMAWSSPIYLESPGRGRRRKTARDR